MREGKTKAEEFQKKSPNQEKSQLATMYESPTLVYEKENGKHGLQ